jgi:hypothetical protein
MPVILQQVHHDAWLSGRPSERHREAFVAAFRQALDMDAPKCGPDTCSVYKANDNIESAIGAEC